jgi:small subunit ribosomal protein S1
VKVKIIAIDTEKGRVSIGMKQLKTDPWLKIDEKYPVGSRVKGKVVGIVEYGAFVELEQGLEGLLHVSEMSWDKKFKNPQSSSTRVTTWNSPSSRSTSRRNASPWASNSWPRSWDELEATYPPGSIVKGKVKNFTEFGCSSA